MPTCMEHASECVQTCASDSAPADNLGDASAARVAMKDYLANQPELAAKLDADELLKHFGNLVQHFGGPALA